ncbi:MAG TPA: SpoIIE family protein phosphatase, partial [Spirochaetota bacterium]|nr:SpoIIE family protein phosphatase [Spirochaetota bacterium]
GGLPLGMDDNDFFLETVTLRKIKLKPGDIFFEYTDGISEAMNPARELFGDERLHDALIKSSSKKIDVMIRNIASAVQEFTGIDFISGNGSAEINDDIAMLALKRLK